MLRVDDDLATRTDSGFLENANGIQTFVGLFRNVIHMCIPGQKLCPGSYTNALSQCVTPSCQGEPLGKGYTEGG